MVEQTFAGGFGNTGPFGSFQESASSLGSLTQEARLKNLRAARVIFVVVGLLTIIANIAGYAASESMVEQEINQEIEQMQRQGVRVDYRHMYETRLSFTRSAKVLSVVMIGTGLLYLAFAVAVTRYPVPVTISGLVIYVGAAAVFGVLDPTTLVRALIIKVLIVIALVKAVQSAIAFERERREDLAAAM